MSPPENQGTVANTDHSWYDFLLARPDLDEINFWSPSPRRTFRGQPLSPFFFRLKAPERAVCGFAFFARYERLPPWLAWEAFGVGNGAGSLHDLQQSVSGLRQRIGYEHPGGTDEIGCILLVEPIMFPRDLWVREPEDWKPRTQAYRYYDLNSGEGARLLDRCRAAARTLGASSYEMPQEGRERAQRYGSLQSVRPRLGQGIFRVATMEAYGRACAVTGEHSLPALEAAHIKPYADGGSHAVSNGMLLRADLHRLFDRGYVTVEPDLRLVVSGKLKEEFENGRSYYPLQGKAIRQPKDRTDQLSREMLEWHNERVFRG